MKTSLLLCLGVILLSAGCARVAQIPETIGSIFDGKPKEIRPEDIRPLVPENKVVRSIDARPVVQQVTSLEITPTSGGVVVSATGTAKAAGTYSAQLVELSRAGGTLVFSLRSFTGSGGGGRTVSVAEFVSNTDLAGITRIEVQGAQNSLSRSAR